MFKAQYEVLRANGHSPSEAFNETVEEATQSLFPLIGQYGYVRAKSRLQVPNLTNIQHGLHVRGLLYNCTPWCPRLGTHL